MTLSEGTDETTVRLESIGVVRRTREGAEVEILHDISFSARSGEITVVIGPSGGGKQSGGPVLTLV